MSDNIVYVYEAKDGWRWHEKAPNGELVTESGEAYTRKADADEAARRENPGLEVRVPVKLNPPGEGEG